MFTQSISTKKLIREMDTTEIEDYIQNKWTKFCNKNEFLFKEIASTRGSDIALCIECYKQLTKKDFDINLLT